MSLLPLLLLPVLMYFLLIRPQQRKMRAQQALLSSVEEGDEIMTSAGIYGFVTAIEGDVMWVEIAEGVDIRVNRAAIGRKIVTTDADSGVADHDAEPEPADGTEPVLDAPEAKSTREAKTAKDDAES